MERNDSRNLTCHEACKNFHGIRYINSLPSLETFHPRPSRNVFSRGWIGYCKGRGSVSAFCQKNYMIAGNASFSRLRPPFSLHFQRWIRKYDQLRAREFIQAGRTARRRSGCRSYPSDFMDDHGPLRVSTSATFTEYSFYIPLMTNLYNVLPS